MPTVLGYVADWSKLPLTRLPWRRLTHAAHAFATLDEQGRATLPVAERSRLFCDLARRARCIPLLAVGGAESGRAFAQATRTPEATGELVDRLAAACRERGYEGLDIDWEFIENVDQNAAYLRLLDTIRERWGEAVLTSAIPAGEWNGRWIDARAAAERLQFLQIMAYDFAGPWGEVAGHNAPRAAVEGAIAYWLDKRGCPAQKLLLGIPLYGRGFRATRWGQAIPRETIPHSYVAYHRIRELAKEGWSVEFDTAARSPYLEKPDGGEIISYDDFATVRWKGELARKRGLAGVFFWEVTLDGPGFPLVEAGRAGLTGRRTSAPGRRRR